MINICRPEIKVLDFTYKSVLPAVNTCYDLSDEDPYRVRRVVLSNKHLAVLRHSFASVKISGISRAIGRQILRKAHADYLELSQRYVDVRDAKFAMPYKIAADENLAKIYTDQIEESLKKYVALREAGATKEDARYLLPQAIETKIVMSGNLQMWWNFFSLRISNRVQKECRDIAELILAEFINRWDLFRSHPKARIE